MALKTNEKAPDFCLENMVGAQTCLQDMKGKWVVLYFYPKDNTPGCTLEAINFTNALKDFQKMNTEIIGISPDSVQSHCNFAEKHDLKLNLLSDPDKNVLEKYSALKPKVKDGKEYMGVKRSTYLIDPEGIIKHIWPDVKVENHANEVKELISKYIS